MNAPAHIVPPQFAKHADAVLTFLPGCHGKDLELRCRLMSARETATFALTRGSCSEASAGVVQEIARLATLYAYAPLTTEQLEALLQALRRLMSAVGYLDDVGDGGARG